MKLSEHFSLGEFTKRSRSSVTPVQVFMLHNLCNILESMRGYLSTTLGHEVPFRVTSGLRLPSDNNRLRNAGFSPSETSDHFYGDVVKLRSSSKKRVYGKYYTFSVGAADVAPSCGADTAWKLMLPLFQADSGVIDFPDGSVQVGQCILEKRHGYWLHVSNPPSLIYNEQIVQQFLSRPHFLTSEDNGKTYRPLSRR